MKKRILMVDDEASRFAVMLPLLLREYDLRFEEESERAYIAAFEFLPDIFLLDQVIDEVHGVELAARLRSHPRFARTPIIIISGTILTPNDESPTVIGEYPAFSKPVSTKALKKCIEEQLAHAA